MKQPYMPPRNRGHFVQDMPRRRINWVVLLVFAFDTACWAFMIAMLDLGLHHWGLLK